MILRETSLKKCVHSMNLLDDDDDDDDDITMDVTPKHSTSWVI